MYQQLKKAIKFSAKFLIYCQNIVYFCKKFKVIETERLHIAELKKHFETEKSFKTNDIVSFYKRNDPKTPQSTINWRIHYFVQKGILERLGRGIFRLGKNRVFIPDITSQQKTIYNKVSSLFPFSNFCIWNTSIINEFSLHQSNINLTLIEVETESLQSVFLKLKEIKKNIFIEPTIDIIDNYVFNTKKPTIVKNLITEAPLQEVEDITTITIEKLLVDLFCDKELFFAYQGKELRIIMEESFSKYSVNQSKMIRYANRRGKKEVFIDYLKQIQIIGSK